MLLAERQGVEIDYCPECRGIWLDRGELDKIIERASLHSGADSGSRRSGYGESAHEGDRKPRKKNFLSEIFDFD